MRAKKPTRVFVDGLTQLRYLAANPFQFRKEALAFLRYLCEIGATVLFTSESNEAPDQDLQFIADAVIELEFCDTRRRIARGQIPRLRFSRRTPHAAAGRQRDAGLPAAAAGRVRRRRSSRSRFRSACRNSMS